jgi:hypothetical protein
MVRMVTIEFRMGSTTAENLSIAVLGREHPRTHDYWDGNWIDTKITVSVGGFNGRVRASLRTDEIHSFNESLKVLNQNLVGEAMLDSMEHWIKLAVTAGSRGRIEISGTLRDQAVSGNVLSFELAEVDQTYLAGWISNLDDIETAYPVIGRP